MLMLLERPGPRRGPDSCRAVQMTFAQVSIVRNTRGCVLTGRIGLDSKGRGLLKHRAPLLAEVSSPCAVSVGKSPRAKFAHRSGFQSMIHCEFNGPRLQMTVVFQPQGRACSRVSGRHEAVRNLCRAPFAPPAPPAGAGWGMADKDIYDKALLRLQSELVGMHQWVRDEQKRLVIVVEGRDAAGKGGVIKRITEHLNPRWCRIAALPAPSDREKTEWYFQRYISHLPAGGEIVLFDRSWYNRAGVERVMGFCTDEEYHRFLRQCPAFERMLIDDGIVLVKYWFSVSDEEQERRFKERLSAPLKRWKLSQMDIEGRNRWVEYSKAKDEMFAHCDLPDSPWYEVEADDKRRARLNCIAHLLSVIPYQDRKLPKVKLSPRPSAGNYQRPPRDRYRHVPDYAATIA